MSVVFMPTLLHKFVLNIFERGLGASLGGGHHNRESPGNRRSGEQSHELKVGQSKRFKKIW